MRQKLLVIAVGTGNVSAIRQALQNRGEKYVMEPASWTHPRKDEMKFFVDEPQHTRLTQELRALLQQRPEPERQREEV